ncbi:hypothetical protein BX616_001810 [Lobosporangium transversale]|uniref:Uncharacterized protein n=1 Tax=Lobosporangium transversale TaxID=64571 RepID=A0A1Y2GAG2_9FUNG|nr:hypothetical protein BCR41DRAFT_361782 [Lobosporangium transversale]KAF9902771.1 hypothetical protein BX616_001810 [Lobosporangium transversale]ORZ05555.1 hypothetical protein BCR41DRAFT_361782 [Lobosporangium transversale]|eukprot:XP_021877129.1 hypothetical protein BCR41DRAFT_361782 [Lobosporangium transversale]
MTVEDSDMQKLWRLTNELTAQLVFNRNASLELKQQLADLQGKATGFTPLLASPYYGDSHYHSDFKLRVENERLREENSQLQEQLREYERWMEYIMGKFRLQNFAMAQSRKESMHEAYKMAEQGGEAAMRLQEENVMLQSRLSDLGAAARKAIHEEYYATESLIESLEAENQCLREMLGVAEGDMGAVQERLDFYRRSRQFFVDEDDEDMRSRHGRNRVSFPSTGTGSYPGSSGSEEEEPLRPTDMQQQHQQRQQQHQPLSPTPSHGSQEQGFTFKKPFPLSVQTSGMRSPTTASSAGSPRSMSALSSSTASPISSPWSASTSGSNSTLTSPALLDSAEQFKSISPPLDDTKSLTNEQKQKFHRGKITINTKLGSPMASRKD